MTRFALTAVLAVTAAAPALAQQTRSGLLLGIYAQSQNGGLAVHGFIPGYSAETVLRQNDVLMRATADGLTILPTRTLFEMENVKEFFGPGRDVALEVYRPGVGYEYCWVTFTSTAGPALTTRSAATFKSGAAKPGARGLFNKAKAMPRPGHNVRPAPILPAPKPPHGVPHHSGGSGRDAAGLFGRN